MDSLLQKLYYDPKSGFISADKLYHKAKALDRTITKRQVREWYRDQDSIQQYSDQRKKVPDFKITSSNPNEWQMDLAFWQKQPILIAVNINSRIGYALLLKNKRAATVHKAIDQFITEHRVSALMSDNGSEFTNDRVETFLDKNDIEHANSIPGDHRVLGKIDRFIRTIKARLTKMQDAIGFKKLTQKRLNDAISNYNDTTHSALKAAPNKMKGRVIFAELEHNKRVIKQVQDTIPAGSIVRYKLEKKTFAKESARWSRTVYEVMGLDGLKVRIKSKNNHVLYKSPNEIKLVNAAPTDAPIQDNMVWEVEKIIDHKKLPNGKTKYQVKWKGYDVLTWETQDNLRLVNKNKMSAAERKYFSNV